jgi:hypothetical protein
MVRNKGNDMIGFVNVSNMSSRDIQRMGHEDDHDQPVIRLSSKKSASQQWSVSDVWAAACAAQRINGGYFKQEQWMPNATPPYIANRRNRDVMMEFLMSPTDLTVEDVEAGEAVRKWLQHDLTFRALKSKLTEFDTATQKCLAVTDRFYTVCHRYELAVIAALPNSHAKVKAREVTQDRLAETSGELIGNVGDKVTLNVEVIRSAFSKNWNIWFVTVVTEDNRAVFFSNKAEFTSGTQLSIKGTVKAHKDGQTQLNRVSII